MFNSALNTICEEHRSLASVVQGLRFLVSRYRTREADADFALLRAIVFYLREFPQKQHHPKEDAYLLELLQKRTAHAKAITAELKKQHREESKLVAALEAALEAFSDGAPGGMDAFAMAAEQFSDHVLDHMALEENSLLPLAQHYLSGEDWVTIGEAFGDNGDPRFNSNASEDFSQMFRQLLELATSPGSGTALPGGPG